MKRYAKWQLITLAILVLTTLIFLPTTEAKRDGKPSPQKQQKAGGTSESLKPGTEVARQSGPTKPDTATAANQNQDQDNDPDLPSKSFLSDRIDKGEYQRLRDEYIGRLRGIEPGQPFDPTLRVGAIKRLQQQESALLKERLKSEGPAPLLSLSSWTELGPRPIPNGQTQQFPATAPTSGRATAVVVDPTNSNKVYLATAQGGVWRSTDGGSTWTAIFDTAQSLAIGALALAPSDPTKLYVGTGEANNSGDSFFGVGVYRIDNVDTAATLVGPINPLITTGSGGGAITYNCFTGRAISKILVDPANAATIFVSTATGIGGIGANALSNTVPPLALRGVFRSTNATAAAASVTFTKLIVNTDNSLDSPGTGNTSIFDMVLEPGNANNLLATPSGAVTGGGVWRSTNALATTPTFTNTLFPGFNGLVMKLAINKVAAVVTVYVDSNEPSVGAGCNAGRVRKSTDGGVTWSAPLVAAEGYCGGQCFYDNPIGVDPNDANIVYLGGNARGTCSDVLKRSGNGGTTFTRDDTGLHADSHALFFDTLTTPTTVWFANDGGIWKRPDAVAGTAWLNENNGPLGSVQFQSVAVHPTDANFTIGGTQDNGTEAQQTSPGNWTSAESGDGGFALIDQSATNTTTVTMYHTFFNQTNNLIGFDRTNLGACLAVKDSWEWRGAGIPPNATPSCDGTAFAANNGISLSDTVLFYAPMALGPGTPNTLYFGTDRLYRSTNRGDTMTLVSQAPLTAGIPISAIGISPTNDNVRIVGLRNGSVFATITGSSSLSNTSFPFPTNATASTTNRFISRAVIDPTNSNTAYITLAYYTNPATAGNIWRTTNLNAGSPTWTSIGNSANGLPNIPVNAFAVDVNDPTNPGISVLYAGTDIGVYSSSDGGATWNPFGLGLPRSAVFDMAIQPTNRVLRVATHGRGMWEIALPVGPSPDLTIVKTHSGNFFQGQVGATYTITVTNSGTAPTSGAVTVTDNAPAGLYFTGASGTGWNCSASAPPNVSCTRSDSLPAGQSYPPITVTVNVADNAPAAVTNTATVSGGGEPPVNQGNNTANDPTAIDGRPDVRIAKTHGASFNQGQAGATYTITVDNIGRAPTTGTVTVTDSLPAGLTATAMGGAGWACTPIPASGTPGPATLTCTRSDALAPSTSYPITLTVNVADNAPFGTNAVTNTASVSGGGEIDDTGAPGVETDNDTVDDPTTINGVPDVAIAKTHNGNFFRGQVGATYTITVRNIGGVTTTGTTTVTDTLPAGLTLTSASGSGWTCSISSQTVTCTSTANVPSSTNFPPITLTVDVASDAPPSVTNCATVSGGGENEGPGPGIETDNDTACDPTNIFQANDTLLINYFAGANGARPDQTVRVTNPGTATDPSGTLDLCANIYVFRNDQQLAECCSCLVTPNGLRTLSVDFDLTHNPLTPGALGEGVIKIVPSLRVGTCLAAVAASPYLPLPALRAWGVHNQDVSGGLQGSAINQATETLFLPATLSQAELSEIQTNCGFILSQGSGHGICLCGRGD